MINITSPNFAKFVFSSNDGPILTLDQYNYITGLIIVIATLIIQLITSESPQKKDNCKKLTNK